MSKMDMKKILVVEDDELIANIVKEILELEGFLVEVAGGGVEGLEKIKQNKYDLVISDYLMPEMNGEELYREVQKINQDLASRIIFISGVTNDFLNSLGNKFLAKPFSPKELIETVKRMLP